MRFGRLAAFERVTRLRTKVGSKCAPNWRTSAAESPAWRSLDAKVLADLVCTDRHNHRPVAGDSDLAQEVRALARAHQAMMCAVQRWVSLMARRCQPKMPFAAGLVRSRPGRAPRSRGRTADKRSRGPDRLPAIRPLTCTYLVAGAGFEPATSGL